MEKEKAREEAKEEGQDIDEGEEEVEQSTLESENESESESGSEKKKPEEQDSVAEPNRPGRLLRLVRDLDAKLEKVFGIPEVSDDLFEDDPDDPYPATAPSFQSDSQSTDTDGFNLTEKSTVGGYFWRRSALKRRVEEFTADDEIAVSMMRSQLGVLDSAALGVSNENLWWYLKYNDLDVDVACESYAGMKKWRMAMNIDRISWHVVSDFLQSGCAKWTGKDCCNNPLLTLYHSRLDTKASYGSTQFLGCLYLLELAEGNAAYCPSGKESFFYDSRNRGFTLLYDCHIASLSSEYSFAEELHFLQLFVDNVCRYYPGRLGNIIVYPVEESEARFWMDQFAELDSLRCYAAFDDLFIFTNSLSGLVPKNSRPDEINTGALSFKEQYVNVTRNDTLKTQENVPPELPSDGLQPELGNTESGYSNVAPAEGESNSSDPNHDATGKAVKSAASSGNLQPGEEEEEDEHGLDVPQTIMSPPPETSESESSRYKNTPETNQEPPVSNSFSDILSGIIGKDSSTATAFSLE